MRPFVLAATALALVLVGCGDEPATRTTVSESTALPVTIERTGGEAGIRDTLVVRPDGTGTLTSRDGIDDTFSAWDDTIVVEELAEDVPVPLLALKRAAGEVMAG
jgi:hypothetical protein